MGSPIYHLDFRVERCHARLSVNDLPLGELTANGTQPEWFAPPANPYLVGSDNMVEVSVRPAIDDDLEPIDLSEAEVEVAVVRVERGEPIAPGEGNRVAVLSIGAELRARIQQARDDEEELELPQTFFLLFDNEGAGFSAQVRDDEALDDEAGLRDYAIVLRDIVRARDVAAMVREMEPKVQAYAQAYDDSPDRIRESLEGVLRDQIFPAGPVTDFERDEVQLVSLCGGRIWELRQPNGRPLVASEPDEEGSSYQIPILVGRSGGQLKVVR